jgi:hypothetical protein
MKHSWPFGDLFCKIWLTIDDVSTMASVLSIVAITIERYWSINHGVHYRRHTNKTRIRIFSALIWLIPLLNFAPGIWFLKPIDDIKESNHTKSNYSECIGAYHSHTLYLIIAQINFFAWPLVVIIALNALIVVNLYRRSHRFPNTGTTAGHELPKKDNLNNYQQHHQLHHQQAFRMPKLKKVDEARIELAEHRQNIPTTIRKKDSYSWKKTDTEVIIVLSYQLTRSIYVSHVERIATI